MVRTTSKKTQRGKFISHNLQLEPHELKTIEYFLALGRDVELNLPSLTPNINNPDFWMDGLVWEAKCPFVVNNSKRIAVLFRRATNSL